MNKGSKNGIFAFDRFKLDVEKLMLYRDGEEILLPAKVAKTLAVLVENAGSILSYDELIERVWEDSIVEDSNLTHYIYVLRKTLGTMPDGQSYIETLRRRGYRFHGVVTVEAREALPVAEPPNIRIPSAPSIHGVERDGNVLRVVEWNPSVAQDDPVKPGAVDTSHRRSFPRAAIVFGTILVLGVTAAAFTYFWRARQRSSTAPQGRGEVSVAHLTSGRSPLGATISPDGNTFVYHEVDGDVARMFVQQVGQTSRIEIETSREKVFLEKTFSPDGRVIYYTASTTVGGPQSVYRIPTMGGSPSKLIDNVNSGVSFSPDGSQMVFMRSSKDKKATAIVIADRDGRGEHPIVERTEPIAIVENASWSPDGKLIVFAETDVGGSAKIGPHVIRIVNAATGEIQLLSEERWDYVHRVNWLPDQAGIVLVATRKGESYSTKRDQLYYVSYPEGISRRLSTDGNRHEPDSLGVTRDGTVLSVSGNRSAQIYSLAATEDASKAQQITRGTADGRAGLAPLPDGRIGFLSRNADEIILVVARADGTDAKQLSTGFPFCEELRADPLGRFFVFSTVVDGKNHLFRINADGSGVEQLTLGDSWEIDSGISPDGQWIAYDSRVFEVSVERSSIFRMPIAGGVAVKLTTDCAAPTYSPDGSMISCVDTRKREVRIVSAVDGTQIQSLALPTFAGANFGIGWTRDGSGLTYIAGETDVTNIWVLPRNGSKPLKLTNFTGGTVSRYAFAPDYSRLFISRGYPIQDVVTYANFR